MTKKPDLVDSRTCYKSENWRIDEDTVRMPSGAMHVHATLVHPGAVVIIPVASDGKLLLLRQYRHSFRDFIFEFPAGTLDHGEAPHECAKREIIEETGFAAQSWVTLGQLYPAPGFCNEIQHCYLARELSRSEAFGDADEIISVEEVGVREFEGLVLEGRIHDSKSISSFFLARMKGLL
jgi:ADP-ribose pyrophosphatase